MLMGSVVLVAFIGHNTLSLISFNGTLWFNSRFVTVWYRLSWDFACLLRCELSLLKRITEALMCPAYILWRYKFTNSVLLHKLHHRDFAVHLSYVDAAASVLLCCETVRLTHPDLLIKLYHRFSYACIQSSNSFIRFIPACHMFS